jgi:hypothetical protein
LKLVGATLHRRQRRLGGTRPKQRHGERRGRLSEAPASAVNGRRLSPPFKKLQKSD